MEATAECVLAEAVRVYVDWHLPNRSDKVDCSRICIFVISPFKDILLTLNADV